jgi:hypothetical protein
MGRECDLIEAGLNDAAVAAEQHETFSLNELRWPAMGARTTLKIWHECCFAGASDFNALSVAEISHITTRRRARRE